MLHPFKFHENHASSFFSDPADPENITSLEVGGNEQGLVYIQRACAICRNVYHVSMDTRAFWSTCWYKTQEDILHKSIIYNLFQGKG